LLLLSHTWKHIETYYYLTHHLDKDIVYVLSTSDFNTTRSLAIYLSKVASNETLYLSFLKEKDRFSVQNIKLYSNGMCSLCKQLNNNYTRQTLIDINDWYPNQCVSVSDM
jgi:hypothetical protein